MIILFHWDVLIVINVGHKAVILGSNDYIGLNTIECLTVHEIFPVAVDYTDKYIDAAKSKYGFKRLAAPHHKEVPAGFIRFLKNYALRQSAPSALISGHDSSVEVNGECLEEIRGCYLVPQTEPALHTRVDSRAAADIRRCA